MDESRETVQKKIRAAALMKIPYTIVVGDRDIEAGNTQGYWVWRGGVIADDSRLIGVDENPGCRNRPA